MKISSIFPPAAASAAVVVSSPLMKKIQQAAAARDSFLRAAGHTTQGSQALRLCAENAFLQNVREGDGMSSTLEAQRCAALGFASIPLPQTVAPQIGHPGP